MSRTMRTLVVSEFGSPFNVREAPVAEPGEGQVLVRVVASGVNPLDTKIRAGRADHARVSTPAVLGIDMAGVVEAVGAGVNHLAVGDEVYGMSGGVGINQGALAEYQLADAQLVAPKPANLTMLEAAALPLAVITAWEGLVDRAGAGAGDRVLVQGGGGGVGQAAVQIALARGAQVFATDTGDALEIVRKAGAQPIDFRTTTPEEYVAAYTGGDGFDVIFDTVGGPSIDASFGAVRRYTGHVVSILGWGQHSLAPLSFRGATYSGVFTLLPLLTGEGRSHHGEILREAAKLAEAGHLTPTLHPEIYTFRTIEAAYDMVESGNAAGKVVVQIGE